MIELIQGLWVGLILVLLVCRFKIGLALYMAYILLVPFMNINIAGVSLRWNLVNIFVFLVAIWEFKYKRRNFKINVTPLIPFLLYFGVSLVMMPFQDDTPIDVQFNFWRASIMQCMILPFALWNYMRLDKYSIVFFRNIVFTCIIIAVLYGLFLTTTPGLNPYILLMSSANGSEFNEEYALALDQGRLWGRISSVFLHPMIFGLFLGLAMVYTFFNRKKMNKYVFAALFLVIVIDSVVCGVRSVLGGITVAIAVYFLQGRNFKIMFAFTILAVIGYFVISGIPDLSSYIGSITDIHNKNQAVSGSSVEMRLAQLEGCFNEIRNCFLQGKGFGWTDYYTKLHDGNHPIILAFESLIYVILCNSGFIGVVLWGVIILKIMRYNMRFQRETSALLDSLLVFYIAYSCITGEYGYMRFFIIFYVLMLGENLLNNPRFVKNIMKNNRKNRDNQRTNNGCEF